MNNDFMERSHFSYFSSNPSPCPETGIAFDDNGAEAICVSRQLLADRLEPESLCLKSSINRNLMDYGKTSGMVLAQKYYPDLFPFYDFAIAKTMGEWGKVKNSHGEQMMCRVDYPLGMSRNNAIAGTTGKASSIPELIELLRRQGPDGVVVLCKCRDTIIPRYQNAGGFNISFSIGKQVIIELAGYGFDGSDLTRGAAVHERFVLPWNAMRDLAITEDATVRHNLSQASAEYLCVDQDFSSKYHDSVYRRCRLLIDECHYDAEKAYGSVPQRRYIGISNRILRAIYNKIIKPTVARSATFWHAGLTDFSVQGNIPCRVYSGCSIEIWEIFRRNAGQPIIGNNLPCTCNYSLRTCPFLAGSCHT